MNQPTRERKLTTIGGGASGETWAPMATEKNGYSFSPGNPNNAREGYLIEAREGVGKNDSTVYCFHRSLPDGTLQEKFSMWEDMVLGDKLQTIISKYGYGVFVVIEYKGRKHKKGVDTSFPWSQTNSFHIWEVMVDEGAPKYNPHMQQEQPVVNQMPQQQQPVVNQVQQQPKVVKRNPVAPPQQQVQQQPTQTPVQNPLQNTGMPITDDDLPF